MAKSRAKRKSAALRKSRVNKLVDPISRGGRKRRLGPQGVRDPVTHRRPPDLGTPELRAKRAALVAGREVDEAILGEAIEFLKATRPSTKSELARTLSPGAKALLSQQVDESLSVHPLGAMHARRLRTAAGKPVVTREGLWAATRYAELHHSVFSSRRSQVSLFFRLYVSQTFGFEPDLGPGEIKQLAIAEARLTNAEAMLRDAGDLARRLVRNVVLFDYWPSFLADGQRGARIHEGQLAAIKDGLDGLEKVLLSGSRRGSRPR